MTLETYPAKRQRIEQDKRTNNQNKKISNQIKLFYNTIKLLLKRLTWDFQIFLDYSYIILRIYWQIGKLTTF